MIRETAVFFHDFSEEGMLAGNVLLAYIASFFLTIFSRKRWVLTDTSDIVTANRKRNHLMGVVISVYWRISDVPGKKQYCVSYGNPMATVLQEWKNGFFPEKDFVTIDQS